MEGFRPEAVGIAVTTTERGARRGQNHKQRATLESKHPSHFTPAADMWMADANMSRLEDVQRELDAVKAERRRRQQALYDNIRPPGSHSLSPPASLPASPLARFSGTVRAVMCWKKLACHGRGNERFPPYQPETGVPRQLLTMAYVPRPDGLLSPCPKHFMGNYVESLDLSPWDLSSPEETGSLWQINRQIKAIKISGRGFDPERQDSLRALSCIGPKLTDLELSHCSGVSSQAIGALLRGLGQQLVSLDLSGCLEMGDKHVAEVARGCPSVTSVDLSSCMGLTDQGLVAFASGSGLSSLQRLLVSGCPGVGDDGLRAVLDGCLALQELSAGGCKEVTGRAFLGDTYPGGVATAPVRGLKRLDLPDCPRLNPSAVEWIAAGCTDLHSLVVSGCISTRPEGVELLAASHPDLLRLGVAGCEGLGRSTALAFVAQRSGSYLRYLDISDNPCTAAADVGKLLRSCRRLETVDLSGLTKVDHSSFQGLGGGRPYTLPNGQIITDRNNSNFSGGGSGETGGEKGGTTARAHGPPGLPHLRVVRMLRLPGLDDASLVLFADACPGLEELLLSDSPKVTGASLTPVATLCPLLRSLGLDRCSAASDEASIADTCRLLPALESLGLGIDRDHNGNCDQNLTGSGHPDDGSTRGSGGGQASNSHASSRRAPYGGVLDASSASCASSVTGNRSHNTCSDHPPFTGKMLLAAASSSCTRLQTLGLEGHKHVSFSSGQCPPGAFPSLTELRLAGCAGVDDGGLVVVLEACPRGSSINTVVVKPGTTEGASTGTITVIGTGIQFSSSSCSSSNHGGSKRGVMVSERAMATGLRPAMHHQLHLAAAAVFSRFDKEQRALETLGRSLRHFRDRRAGILMSSARAICRSMLAYRFRTSNGQPDKVRLMAAKKAAKVIQKLVRLQRARKRDVNAAKFQALWRRYLARCLYLHHIRLRHAAIGFQLLWRGYYVRTRYRVREKVQELKQAKKMLGKQWFKQAAALKNVEHEPDEVAAEQRRREEMRVGIKQCSSFVRAERQRLGALAAVKRKVQAIPENEATAVTFGAMPPAPSRKIVRGMFDVHPKARRLRDGREVPFDGVASLASPPEGEDALSSLSSSSRKGKGNGKSGAGELGSVTAFAGGSTVRDPDDFDVFRKGPGETWDGDETGIEGAKVAADRAWEAVHASESGYDKERSLCGHCKKRFAAVSCEECRLGYCLRCSGRVHAQPDRLGHDLGRFQRPDKAVHASMRGIDGGAGTRRDAKKAKLATRTLPGCARRAEGFLKTMKLLKHKEKVSADEQKVKLKAKDRREMEEAEERARKQNEEYSRASEGEKNAATAVQKTCQAYMKRLRLRRESDLHRRAKDEGGKLKAKESATRIQALYRGYSVRLDRETWANESSSIPEKQASEANTGSTATTGGGGGVVALPVPGAGFVERKKAAAAARARRDCAFRRRWEREAAIAEMKHLEEEASRTFVSDVRWAVEKHEALRATADLVKSRRASARSAWNRLQEEKSLLDPALPAEDPERKRLDKAIELQDIRTLHQTGLLELAEKGVYWTRAFIRQHYRRHAAQVATQGGSAHTFAWLEEEIYALDEVVAFASKRLEGVADVLEQEFFRGWLTDQIARAGKQRLMIDLEQESLLATETARLLKAKSHASKTRENLEELLKAYRIDSQLEAERVGAELANAGAEEGTDAKFLWVSRVTSLKNKEESVRNRVQASLQRSLEEEIAAEDQYLIEEPGGVNFSGDVADAPILHFAKIKASLVEPPHHPAHLSFESWRKVYRAQPWLAAQIQAENKRKAARASTIEGLEEMRAVTAAARSQEAFAAKEVAALKAEIEDIEKRLAFQRSGVAGDARQEPLSDDERTRMEIALVKDREKLLDQEERLERRRKANSHKEKELKQREEDLEAEITAEEERHARQVAAMAAFHAAERDETAAQFGKEHADAAVDRMKARLEKLKAIQEDLTDKAPEKQHAKNKKKGFMGTLVGFALGTNGEVDDESEAQELDYAEQTQLIAKKAKLALVNRQIEDLKKAKKTITLDYASADAQLALAEDIFVGDDGSQDATAQAQKLQARVREAKQRAIDAKDELEMQQQQTKQEEAEQKAKEAKRKAEAAIAKRIAEEMGMGGVGQANGLFLTAQRIKRKIVGGQTVYGGTFDNENAAVEAAIKTRHKAKLGKIEAVDDFAFTVGTEETDAMASKQARLASQGLPSFRKMAKGLGGKECIFLWVRKTLDSSEFITEILVTNADPANAGYKNLKPLGFTSWGHPQLAAKGSGQPSILLWGKKDPHSDGISHIDLSYSQADEKKLSDVGFKVVPGLLVDCGLPDVRLWCKTVKRGANTLPTVKAILHEIGEIRNMRKQNPGDAKLMDVESKLESKLAQAREAEERKAEDRSNPLKSAIETYALTGADVDAFISHFAAMDVDRQGTIEIGAFFEYLEWPRNAFANHLFSFMESADEDGRVDFGDFVKLVCSYCMFGKSDLLRYAYTVYDQGKGFVSFDDLMSLLNDVHKTNSGPIERALRDADIARIGQLSFNHFLDLDKRFPKMFYPVANLQLEIRKKFLGEAFWLKKMHIFNEARGNIIKEADGSASKALKAKLREEEIVYLKTQAKKALSATQKKTKKMASRARQKIEGSKWMSKLLS
eukprot:g16420.t1